MKAIISLVLISVFMFGCSLTKFEQNAPVLELVVRAASARLLSDKPEWVEHTYNISSEAIKHINSREIVDLGELDSYVMSSIPWDKMLPEEKVALTMVLNRVKESIAAQLETEGVKEPEEVKVLVVNILTWVNQTAMMYNK